LVTPLLKEYQTATQTEWDIVKKEFLSEFRKEKKIEPVDPSVLIRDLAQKEDESHRAYYERTAALMRRIGGKDEVQNNKLADCVRSHLSASVVARDDQGH